MEFIPVTNVMKCDMIYHVGTTFATNTLYVKKATAVTQGDCQVVADMCANWWDASIKPLQPDTVAFDHVEVRDLTVESSWYAQQTKAPNVGTSGGVILPMNATMAIKFSSDRAGRSYRGRNYWIGLTEAVVTGDFVSQAFRDSVFTAYQAFGTACSNISMNWVIVSRYHNLVRRETGVATYIAGISIESTVDSQRRRLAGRGK